MLFRRGIREIDPQRHVSDVDSVSSLMDIDQRQTVVFVSIGDIRSHFDPKKKRHRCDEVYWNGPHAFRGIDEGS